MKSRCILLLILILLGFGVNAQWNPAIHIPINDALGQSQQAPIDGRSMFYVTSPPKWRPYQSTAEVLSTLTTTASRFGNFIIIVDSGGSLQSNGTFLNGHNTYYMFADSTTNAGLVKLNLFGSASLPQNLIDSIYRINDSTLGFKELSGYYGSVLLRGTAAGGISSLLLSVPTSLFVNPVNFTNTSGSWVGSLATANQSAGTFFSGPVSGGLGQPGFRQISVSDLPTGIPNGNLTNSSINLNQDNTGTAPGWATSSVSLGDTALYHNPAAGPATSGYLTSSDWIRFNSAVTASVISVNGQTGVVVAKNADSLMSYPIDFTNFHAGWTLSVSSDSTKLVFDPPGSGSGITTLNGLNATIQHFAVGSSGTSPNWNSVTATHTLNIPIVNGADTGLVTPALYNAWNLNLSSISTANSVTGLGTGASPVQLVGDAASPGNSFYYGTNGSGAKGFYSIPSGVAPANPTSQIGLTAINGSNSTFMRSDAAPSLSQSIIPTWTATHTFNGGVVLGSSVSFSTDNTYQIGTNTAAASIIYTYIVKSNGNLNLFVPLSDQYIFNINGSPQMSLKTTGQLQLQAYNAPTSFPGTATSLAGFDASGNLIQQPLIFNIAAVQGLHASVTGDSVEMGGFFFQPDTVNTLGYGFAITNLQEEATLGVGDSVLVEKGGSKYLTLVPSSAIGGGGAVASVSDNGGGTLTISPTTGAVLAGINLANANTWSVGQTFSAGITLGGSITLTGSSGSLNIGDISHVLLHTYTRNVNSDGGLDLNAATGAAVNISINGVIKDATLSTGQKQWGGYGVGTFTGTPAYNISVDATGHAIETSINPDVTTTIVSGSSSTVPNGTNSFIISLTTAGAYAITLPTTWNVNNDLWIRFVGNGTITDGNTMVTSLTIINGSGQTLDQAVAPAGGWLAGESIHYHLLPGSIDHLDN